MFNPLKVVTRPKNGYDFFPQRRTKFFPLLIGTQPNYKTSKFCEADLNFFYKIFFLSYPKYSSPIFFFFFFKSTISHPLLESWKSIFLCKSLFKRNLDQNITGTVQTQNYA